MKPFDPGDMGLFGADGAVFPDGVVDLIEEFLATFCDFGDTFLERSFD